MGQENASAGSLFYFINECLTEITAIELMAKYLRKELPDLDLTRYTQIGYLGPVLIVNELIKKVAEAEKTSYEQALASLQKEQVFGSGNFVSRIGRAVVSQRMRLIASENIYSVNKNGFEYYAVLAEKLGFNDVAQKIRSCASGGTVNPLSEIS